MKFFIIDSDQSVEFTQSKSGEIDHKNLDQIAKIYRKSKKIKLHFSGENFNFRHLNIRTITFESEPTIHVFDIYPKELQKDLYEINTGDFEVEDGVALQLFYYNSWFEILLGDPKIKESVDIIAKDDSNEKFEKIKGVYEIILKDSDKKRFLKTQLKRECEEFIKKYPTSKQIKEVQEILKMSNL